jgi:hypothetical protein
VYAQNVKAGEIAGITLRTIPVGQSGAHIKIYEKYIDFVDANGSSVFQIGIDMPNAESGKPQLFFSNGCSLDTFEGDIRVRTSATNYVRVNSEAHGGGVDYINGQSTISLDGGGVTYAVFS